MISARILVLSLGAVVACSSPRVERFDTPDGAMRALVDAARMNDAVRADQILGPGGLALMESDDQEADREDAERIAAALREKLTFEDREDGTKVACLGDEGWLFPIPLVHRSDGGWSFDAEKGREEIDNRRIGRNELATIATLHEYVDAQNEYSTEGHDGNPPSYALRLRSSPGKHDGLYWTSEGKDSDSPLGPLVAAAAREDPETEDTGHEGFHGYYFRTLKYQGGCSPGGEKSYVGGDQMKSGFALIAWPVAYGESGVMTFVVCRPGIVYQKDLGPQTAMAANAIQTYAPDDSWEPTGR